MNAAVTSDTTDSKGEMCEHLGDTEPLQEDICEVENQVTKIRNGRGLIAQCLVTAVITIATAGAGMPIGYSAVLLPQLKTINGTLRIDEDMGSWIASIHSAATPIGAFVSGTLMEYLGRRTTLQVTFIPLIIGWILITISHNHAILLTGRVFAGICVGVIAAPCQVYIAEISDPRLRGVFTSIPFASYSFGILLVYILGSTAHWRLVAGLSIVLPAVASVMFLFLPESPVWLIRHGKIEKARKACLWLRGGDAVQAKQEIQQLIDRSDQEERRREENYRSKFNSFFAPPILKPLIIVNIFNILQTLSGVYLIVFYAVEIISQMGNKNVNEFFAAVLTAGVRFLFTVVASVMLAFVGRRTIGILSGVGTGLSALCLAVFLYSDCRSNNYFAAVCLLIYVAASTVGLLVLPGVMVGELFPTRARGLAGSLTFTFFNLTIFGITKVFPLLKQILSISGFFCLFGLSSLLVSLFVYCVLPETKGQTLEEIEDYFLQDNATWITRKKRNTNICKTSNVKL